MEAILGIAAALGVISMMVERLSEVLFGGLLKGRAMTAVSVIMSTILCVVFGVDAFAQIGMPVALGSPWSGQIITGIAIGGMGSAFHDLVIKRGEMAKEKHLMERIEFQQAVMGGFEEEKTTDRKAT